MKKTHKSLHKALKIIEMQNIALLEQLYLYRTQDTDIIDGGYYPERYINPEDAIIDEEIDKYCVHPESNMVH